MTTKILAVDGDQATLNWLQTKLKAAGYEIDTANRGDIALQKMAADPPNILVLDLTLPDGDGVDLIRRIREDPNLAGLGIIILSLRTEPDDILAGLNAGADHFIRKRPGADVELIAKIRASLVHPKIGLPARLGLVYSFCSAKGGTGTTSVCINAAYALAQLEPKAKILVVDMVLPLGSVGIALGYESHQTLSKLSQEGKENIDLALAERYSTQPNRWGFGVMLGARDPQEAGMLDVTQVLPIFEGLQKQYDYILVDIGKTLSRISLPIIKLSAAAAVIVTPDTSTVKASQVMLTYLEEHGLNRSQIILINNRTVGRVWTTGEDIERELRLPLNCTIPYVVEYMTMAINDSVPFMAKFPDHSAGHAVFLELARLLIERGKARMN